MPWQVTVHFVSFPEDRLLRLPPGVLEGLKSHFMSTLKEANFLKHGDGNKVMSLSKQDQDELWTSIGSGAAGFERFFEVNDKLLPEPKLLKSVALRVVRKRGALIQLPLKPLREDGSLVTLGEALLQCGVESGRKVRIQGVVPPLDAPVFELQQCMSHPDNFLYATLIE